MSSVQKTLAYWTQFLYNILAMMKQLGIHINFRILFYADLRWEELPYIINKVNNLRLSKEALKSLSYHERHNFLNKNSVIFTKNFQYRVEIFFTDMVLDGRLRKTTYYVLRIELQKEASPNVHSFIWFFDATNIPDEADYIDFIENSKCTVSRASK